jgi:nucleotide-binding universal stress UspA family protein
MSEKFRILVPLDGSELSERVFTWARLFKSAMPEAELELLRCFEPPASIYLIPELAVPATAMFSEGDLNTAINDYLKQKAEELGVVGTTASVVVADPATEILRRSEGANMVLMASHGRGGLGRWLMGSVATKVTRGTTVPVLVVSGKCMAGDPEHPAKIEKVMVAYDGSPAAERAVYRAASLARGFGATVVLYQGLVHVAMPHQVVAEANRADLLRAAENLRALAKTLEGVKSQTKVRETSVSTGIVEYADEIGADLIVIGSHGKSGLARWMIGSETEQVLHEAHCPVLVTH